MLSAEVVLVVQLCMVPDTSTVTAVKGWGRGEVLLRKHLQETLDRPAPRGLAPTKNTTFTAHDFTLSQEASSSRFEQQQEQRPVTFKRIESLVGRLGHIAQTSNPAPSPTSTACTS